MELLEEARLERLIASIGRSTEAPVSSNQLVPRTFSRGDTYHGNEQYARKGMPGDGQ